MDLCWKCLMAMGTNHWKNVVGLQRSFRCFVAIRFSYFQLFWWKKNLLSAWGENNAKTLRYGENPHQRGVFFGKFDDMFEQLQGKEISYNNLLDIDAAVNLINDFDDITFAILKHNNACGIASRPGIGGWQRCFGRRSGFGFGGVLITNAIVDRQTAIEMNKIFFEVVIAPRLRPRCHRNTEPKEKSHYPYT